MSVLEFELTSVHNQSLSSGGKVSNEYTETEEASRSLRRMMGNRGARKVADVGCTERTTGQPRVPFSLTAVSPVQQEASPHSWPSSGEAIKNRWRKLSFNKGRSHPFQSPVQVPLIKFRFLLANLNLKESSLSPDP